MSLILKNLAKNYQSDSGKPHAALKNLDLELREGELLGILGPSGSGKSTLLRLIAGFEDPDQGDILWKGESMLSLSPQKRPVGIVFQSAALFPDLRVFQNISYGLRVRRIGQPEIQTKVAEWMGALSISHLADRYPHELSGGEAQRVALARTLVIHPRILLLDEPLSQLDTPLRGEMRSLIVDLQRKLHLTTIFVSHNSADIIKISDRVGILNQGEWAQIATPEELRKNPTSSLVQSFLTAD